MIQCPVCQKKVLDTLSRCPACGASLARGFTPLPPPTMNSQPEDWNPWVDLSLDLLWSLGMAALVVLVICMTSTGIEDLNWLRFGVVVIGIMAALGITWRQSAIRNQLLAAVLAVVVTLSAVYVAHWVLLDRSMGVIKQTMSAAMLEMNAVTEKMAKNISPTEVRKLSLNDQRKLQNAVENLPLPSSLELINHIVWKDGWGTISTVCSLAIAFFLAQKRALR